MRDLRKVDVKSAVFSVPHSKGFVRMLTIRMLAHPCAGHFREHLVCVAFISRHNAEPKASECNTEAIPVLKLPQACPGRRAYQGSSHSRVIARISYHRNVGGRAARLPIHP